MGFRTARIVVVIKKNASSLISFVLLLVLGLGIYGKVDPVVIMRIGLGMDPAWGMAAIAAILPLFAVNALRLSVVIRWLVGGPPPFAQMLRLTFISAFVTIGAPIGALGDVARVVVMRVLGGLRSADAIRSVLYDRIIGMLGMIAVGVMVLPLQLFTPLGTAKIVGQALVMGAGTLGLVFVIVTSKAIGRTMWARRSTWLVHVVDTIGGFEAAMCRPSRLGAQFLIAIANTAVLIATLWALAHGMQIAIPFWGLVLFVPVIQIVNNLPIFYMGWGGREAAMLGTIGLIADVPHNQVIALSIAYGLLAMLVTLPGGMLLALARWRRKPAAQQTAA